MRANQPNHYLSGKSGSVWARRSAKARGFTVEKKGLVQAFFAGFGQWPASPPCPYYLGFFSRCRLRMAYTWTAAVFVDELDAGGFKCTPYNFEGGSGGSLMPVSSWCTVTTPTRAFLASSC
jgi:hypothetical protein